MESEFPRSFAIAVQEAIYLQDVPELQKQLEQFLVQTISFHVSANEIFYHGLVLGLCAMLDNCYRITSNRLSGHMELTDLPADGIIQIPLSVWRCLYETVYGL